MGIWYRLSAQWKGAELLTNTYLKIKPDSKSQRSEVNWSAKWERDSVEAKQRKHDNITWTPKIQNWHTGFSIALIMLSYKTRGQDSWFLQGKGSGVFMGWRKQPLEACGAGGKWLGKGVGVFCSVQVYLSRRALHVQKVTKQWTLVHAQMKGQWFHPVWTSSARSRHAWLQVPKRSLGKHLV